MIDPAHTGYWLMGLESSEGVPGISDDTELGGCE